MSLVSVMLTRPDKPNGTLLPEGSGGTRHCHPPAQGVCGGGGTRPLASRLILQSEEAAPGLGSPPAPASTGYLLLSSWSPGHLGPVTPWQQRNHGFCCQIPWV